MLKFRCSAWETRLSLKVGDKGTLKEYEKFGDALLCVRYRYNRERQRRVKTVEIVVEEIPWRPKEVMAQTRKTPAKGAQSVADQVLDAAAGNDQRGKRRKKPGRSM